MCTELILAIIYFLTICIVNYFLFKLLKTYFNNIFYLLKLKNICKFFKNHDLDLISFFYFENKNKTENKNIKRLNELNKFSNTNDSLIIGNIYKFLNLNLEKNSKISDFLAYYLKLLENQYLSINILLK